MVALASPLGNRPERRKLYFWSLFFFGLLFVNCDLFQWRKTDFGPGLLFYYESRCQWAQFIFFNINKFFAHEYSTVCCCVLLFCSIVSISFLFVSLFRSCYVVVFGYVIRVCFRSYVSLLLYDVFYRIYLFLYWEYLVLSLFRLRALEPLLFFQNQDVLSSCVSLSLFEEAAYYVTLFIRTLPSSFSSSFLSALFSFLL